MSVQYTHEIRLEIKKKKEKSTFVQKTKKRTTKEYFKLVLCIKAKVANL